MVRYHSQSGKFECRCDTCRKNAVREANEVRARLMAKAKGWFEHGAKGKEKHVCPSCMNAAKEKIAGMARFEAVVNKLYLS